jgi:hypothetical protein
MAEQSNILEEGRERVSAAYESLDREFQRLQKQFQSRRKSLERQLASGRRQIEKRTRKQVDQLRSELRKNGLLRRARSVQANAVSRIEQGVGNVLGAFRIASKSDVQRIDRKLSQISRKLKEIESARRGNGDAAHI